MRHPAVFLDRDGTIIHDRHYIADPVQVTLVPGAAAAVAKLNAAGIPVVVVTNQSGIARGLLTASDYDRVRERMEALFVAEGARLDATYMCPHHPDYTAACECRKPGTLLYRRAAEDLQLDLARSVYVGDRLRDVSPADAFGGTGIMVPSASTPKNELAEARERYEVVASLDEVVDRAVHSSR